MYDSDENKIEEEIFEECELRFTPRVLMVVTNVDKFDEHHKTGVWFEEFARPYLAFLEEGYFVTVASLQGGKAPLDPASDHLLDDLKWKEAKGALEDTTPLESIDYTLYDALVIPGGHGPMFDLAKSELMGEVVSYFDSKSRVIAAICHGPAALLTAKRGEVWFVDGKRMTCFTNDEEQCSKLDGLTPFSLEDELKKKGAFFIQNDEGKVNVVEDQNLITAQNYQSTQTFTNTIIKHLSSDQN